MNSQPKRYTAEEIHARLSRYFEMCPLTGAPADAFTDPLDFLCHETSKRRMKEGLGDLVRAAIALERGEVAQQAELLAQLVHRIHRMAAEASGSGPSREWVLGAEAMRAVIVKRLNAEAYRGSANLVEALALPTPDGRRLRVQIREVGMCTRCGCEAEVTQPGKPDEFASLSFWCRCTKEFGRCEVSRATGEREASA